MSTSILRRLLQLVPVLFGKLTPRLDAVPVTAGDVRAAYEAGDERPGVE